MVVVGHGSQQSQFRSRNLIEHCNRLQSSIDGLEIQGAYLKLDPKLQTAFQSLESDCVYIVPALLSDGYFTNKVIPERVDAVVASVPERDWKVTFGSLIGTHKGMAEVIYNQVESAIDSTDLDDIGLAVVGHGSQRRGVFRGLKSWVSEPDRGFNIFHGSFEHDFTELTEPGSRPNRVVEATT
ncbi:MAG: CbiX/SirB N-terminal domain-containing protein [Halodesulfurarchaeum sp.]